MIFSNYSVAFSITSLDFLVGDCWSLLDACGF